MSRIRPPLSLALVLSLFGCGAEPGAPTPAPVPRPAARDTIPPVVTLQPTDSVTAGTSITISGSAQDDGAIVRVTVRRSAQPCCDGPVDTVVNSVVRSATFSKTYTVAEGAYAFEVAAYDTAGNRRTAVVDVRSDRTAPELYVIGPWSVASASAVISVNGRATPEQTLSVSYAINGGPSVPVGSVTGAQEPYPISPRRNEFETAFAVPIPSDPTSVTVRLTDATGNTAARELSVRRRGPFRAVAGMYHWCVLDEGGAASCWGENRYGQLGTGDTVSTTAPAPVAGGLRFKQLSLGYVRTCGVSTAGDAYCWGGEFGQSLDVHSLALVPRAVPGGIRFASLSAGWAHTCGLTTAGVVYCWGLNGDGALGDGTRLSRDAPRRVTTDVLFDSVAAGDFHTCALARGGEMFCWGQNLYGQVGTGAPSREPITVPTRAASGRTFVSILAAFDHTCGVAADAGAYCWGRADGKQLGAGSVLGPQPTPLPVRSPTPLRSISIAFEHGCGVSATGATYCWGDNHDDRLGRLFVDPLLGYDLDPAPSAYGIPLTIVQTGVSGTCGLTASGSLYCWGSGAYIGRPRMIAR